MIVLNSHNYSERKIKMEDLLIVRDLHKPIDRKEILIGVLEPEWKIINRKVTGSSPIECRSAIPPLLW